MALKTATGMHTGSLNDCFALDATTAMVTPQTTDVEPKAEWLQNSMVNTLTEEPRVDQPAHFRNVMRATTPSFKTNWW